MDSASKANASNETSNNGNPREVPPFSNASQRFIGRCPVLEVEMSGVMVRYLLDTGPMVTTISESFFKEVFQHWGAHKLKTCGWLALKAANSLDFPCVGYLELDIQVLGRKIPGHWFLVVKDTSCSSQQHIVPGILGMNVNTECYRELFAQQGKDLFASLSAIQAEACWESALRHCHRLQTGESPLLLSLKPLQLYTGQDFHL